MLLQVTCLQRSHENLVLILVPLILIPCLHVRDSNVVSPPPHRLSKAAQSIPLHPRPALLAGTSSTVHSVHTDLLKACGLKEIICYGARVGYRDPQLCHTLPRTLIYFLEAQFIITEMTPRLSWLTCWEQGAGGCYLEKGAASQFISGLIQQGKLRIGLTSVYEPKCQRADDTYCKCQNQGIFIFPLREHQQRFSDYWCCYSHRFSMNGAVHIHKHTGEILKGLA